MKVKIQYPFSPDGKKLISINRRRAIAEKCLNCGGFELKSRQNCEFKDCLLYPFRTGAGKQDSQARNRSIRSYCRDVCMEGSSNYVSLCTSPDCPLYAYRQRKIDRSVEVI